MEVEGKRIKIVTGRKTQTVNVCASNDVEGVYSHKVRMMSPTDFVTEEHLAQQGLATINDLVAHLQQKHHGLLENAVPRASPALASSALVARTSRAEVSRAWCDSIAGCVEAALNSIVAEFALHPYRHRVEHSLHCQLFMELHKCPGLDGLHRIGNESIGFIHKEYPETMSRPDKNGRRGNFDLALIGPVEATSPSLTSPNLTILDFLLGLIKPGIAIEVGLDYGAAHLYADWHKLKNSQIQRGYLLHLARETGSSQDDTLEVCQQIIADEALGGPQLALCMFDDGKCYMRQPGQPLSVC